MNFNENVVRSQPVGLCDKQTNSATAPTPMEGADFLEEPIPLVFLYDWPFFPLQLAKKYYFLTNEWTEFDHVTALGQSSETISTLGSVSSYPAHFVTRTSSDLHQVQDAGH